MILVVSGPVILEKVYVPRLRDDRESPISTCVLPLCSPYAFNQYSAK